VKKIGFIDFFLDEWHANNYPQWIKEISQGQMQVAYAFGLKDPESGLSNKEWCIKNNVEYLPSIEQVVDKSDYLIILSPDHPEYHEELSKIPLASGKRTYIDKTFAPDRATAIRLFEMAEKWNTPMFSSSALRFASEYRNIEKDGIEVINSWGPGRLDNYSIHQIEPIVSLMGDEAEKIMFTGTERFPALIIQFSNGRQATVAHSGWECPFHMAVNYESGKSKIINVQSDFFKMFMKELIDFFETGEVKVNSKETIAIITIIEYALKAAQKPFTWIDLPR